MNDPGARLACVNRKGGVGKTTTSIGICLAAARAGRRTLLIDGDPQANATGYMTGLSGDELNAIPVWASAVLGQHTLAEAIISPAIASVSELDETQRSAWSGIDLVPSAPNAASLERTLSPEDLWSERDAIDTIADRYDIIVIDTPPNLGSITLSHLYAVDAAVIVTEPDEWGLDGIREVTKTIRKVARSHTQLRLAGLLINQLDRRERQQREVVESLTEDYGRWLLGPPIPDRAVVRNAKRDNLPITAYADPEARAIVAMYTDLLDRLTALPEGS